MIFINKRRQYDGCTPSSHSLVCLLSLAIGICFVTILHILPTSSAFLPTTSLTRRSCCRRRQRWRQSRSSNRLPQPSSIASSPLLPLVLSLSTGSGSSNNNYPKKQNRSNPQQPQQQRRSKSKFHRTLLDELYHLRKQRNGAMLAEQRLQQSIQDYTRLQEKQQDQDLGDDKNDNDAERAVSDKQEQMKNQDEVPTERCFNLVITAYAKIAHRDWMAPHRAEQLLQQMIQLDLGTKIGAATASTGTVRKLNVQPSIFTYNAVIEAYIKSCTSKSPTASNNQKSGGGSGGRSTSPTSSTTGNTKARRQQQHQDVALRLFRQLLMSENNPQGKNAVTKKIPPNTYSYNLILSLKDPSLHEWKLAESWALSCIEQQLTTATSTAEPTAPDDNDENGKDDDVSPDRQTINLLMASYAQVGDAKKAQDLLHDILALDALSNKISEQMENNDNDEASKSATKQNQHQLVPPKDVWFHCVLKALAKSCNNTTNFETESLPSIGDQADDILEQMLHLSSSSSEEPFQYGNNEKQLHPDITTYNHVLNVHSQCGNTDRAIDMLNQLDRESSRQEEDDEYFVKNVIRPDRVTYTTVLKAYATRQKQVTQHRHQHNHLLQGQEQEEESGIGSNVGNYRSKSSELALEIAQNATNLFERMKSMADSGGGRQNVSPNVFTCKLYASNQVDLFKNYSPQIVV